MMRLAEQYADQPRRRTAAAVPAHPVELPRWTGSAARRCATPLFSNLSDFESADDDGDFDLLETLAGRRRLARHRKRRGHDSAGADPARDRSRGRSSCRPVNAKRFCCVTGRKWTSPKRPPPWAARKAASRRIVRAPSMPWPRRSRPRESHYEHTSTIRPASGSAAIDALQARFALRVAARLTEQRRDAAARHRRAPALRPRAGAGSAPRAARAAQPPAAPVAGGRDRCAGRRRRAARRWWLQLGSVLPLLALVAGLVLIQRTARRAPDRQRRPKSTPRC